MLFCEIVIGAFLTLQIIEIKLDMLTIFTFVCQCKAGQHTKNSEFHEYQVITHFWQWVLWKFFYCLEMNKNFMIMFLKGNECWWSNQIECDRRWLENFRVVFLFPNALPYPIFSNLKFFINPIIINLFGLVQIMWNCDIKIS